MSYTDAISKRSRTWLYGTEKKVTVRGVARRFIICVDDSHEGYVLLGTDSDGAEEGDTGIITFTQGGPFGGYWKFKRDPA